MILGPRMTNDAFRSASTSRAGPSALTIPFDSITGFSDPSVPFGFKLEPRAATEPAKAPAPPREATRKSEANAAAAAPPAASAKAAPPASAKSPEPGRRRPSGARSRAGESRFDRRVPQQEVKSGLRFGRPRQPPPRPQAASPRTGRDGRSGQPPRSWRRQSGQARKPRRARTRRARARGPSPRAEWRRAMSAEAATPRTAIVKRSLTIAGHRTSVSLEDAFWAADSRRSRRRGAARSAG